MSKAEFLSELELSLHSMKDNEKSKFITFYDEMIDDYVENGMTEAEAISKIGTPKKIAVELLENNDSVKLNLPLPGNKLFNIIITIIGFPLWGSLLLTFILSILCVYILIFCLPVSTGAATVGFLAASIIGIIGSPFVIAHSLSTGLMQLGIGIASVGISFFLGLITIALYKKFILVNKSFNAYLKKLWKKKVVIR